MYVHTHTHTHLPPPIHGLEKRLGRNVQRRRALSWPSAARQGRPAPRWAMGTFLRQFFFDTVSLVTQTGLKFVVPRLSLPVATMAGVAAPHPAA